MRIEADRPVYPAPGTKWKRAFIRLDDGSEYPLIRKTEEDLSDYLTQHPGLVGVRALPWIVMWLRKTDELRLWPTPDRDCELELSNTKWRQS